MLKSRVCTWSLTWLLGSLAWSAPGQADACWWWGRRSTYYVAPVVAAPTPVVANFAPSACCAPQQVCQMVPQTAYRMQSVSVPVTSFMPVAAVDGCTGCPTTTLRPVTSFVQQTQMVPYTTYRQVCQSVCPTTACSPIVAAPAATVAAAPGCSTCSAGVPALSTGVTVPAAPLAGATTADIAPTLPQGTAAPTYQATPTYQAPAAAGAAAPAASGIQNEMRPVPDGALQNGGATTGGTSTNSAISPRWSDPRNRTAMHPSGTPRSYNTVSRVVDLRGVPPQAAPAAAVAPTKAAAPVTPTIDVGGWKASSR